jgi:hypothetical protein
MIEYIRAHWRGEHSFARAYWMNVVFGAFAYPMMLISVGYLIGVWVGVLFLLTIWPYMVWQLRGVWISARKSASVWRWPAMGTLVLYGLLLENIISTSIDILFS